MYLNVKVGSLWDWTLPKVSIVLKNALVVSGSLGYKICNCKNEVLTFALDSLGYTSQNRILTFALDSLGYTLRNQILTFVLEIRNRKRRFLMKIFSNEVMKMQRLRFNYAVSDCLNTKLRLQFREVYPADMSLEELSTYVIGRVTMVGGGDWWNLASRLGVGPWRWRRKGWDFIFWGF